MLLSDDTVSCSQTDLRRRALLMAGCGAMAGLAAPKLRAQTANDHGIEGQIAPEIKLDYWIDRDGKPGDFSVLENRGRWIFLKCFQNWCPGCHASGFPALQQFSAAFHDHPQVAIAGIQTVFEGFTSNTQAAVRELQQRYELPITMGHDPGNRHDARGDHRPQTMKNYRTGGTPWLILINPEGTVVYNHFHVNVSRMIEHVRKAVA